MSQRSARLVQLLNLKQRDTREASEAFMRAREQFIANKQRHEQLVEYRKDYIYQLSDIGSSGCTLGHMRNRINFISQLDSALMQLNQLLAQIAKQRKLCEEAYYQAKAAEDAVQKLIERVEKQENIKKNRIEQKESDEYAQKQWYSKKSTTNLKKTLD